MTHDEISEAVAQITRTIPFNQVIGIRVERFEVDHVQVAFDMRPELVGNIPRKILHGGVISATLDLVGGVTALASVMRDREVSSIEEVGEVFSNFGTIDLRVDYLRPGAGETFVATGYVLRVGRRVAVTRMELHNETDVLIAVGTGTYITG
ncbi:MAG: thioesterase family protein [Acidimicrobiia bacterium]|nr:thioesterase family protein [Acidimicrobiia bacterium]MDH4306716.1 thioesterase family protein [Acidimicrobiia bacterium]MDH5292681.1 thioesterase family protein [Acidimicrobiia bacterium]